MNRPKSAARDPLGAFNTNSLTGIYQPKIADYGSPNLGSG